MLQSCRRADGQDDETMLQRSQADDQGAEMMLHGQDAGTVLQRCQADGLDAETMLHGQDAEMSCHLVDDPEAETRQ